jgi:nascent polypeptide-associated complex subunit beta
MTARQAAVTGEAGEKKEGEVGDDDEIPELVENFDEAADKKSADLEELE